MRFIRLLVLGAIGIALLVTIAMANRDPLTDPAVAG